jgi:hypothetical protein
MGRQRIKLLSTLNAHLKNYPLLLIKIWTGCLLQLTGDFTDPMNSSHRISSQPKKAPCLRKEPFPGVAIFNRHFLRLETATPLISVPLGDLGG